MALSTRVLEMETKMPIPQSLFQKNILFLEMDLKPAIFKKTLSCKEAR